MAKYISVNDLEQDKHLYNIVMERQFDGLKDQLTALHMENRKVCIVTDSNVEKLYSDSILQLLKDCAKEVIIFSFPAGESNKTLDTVKMLFETLIKSQFDRKDMLAALGGGVVGDLTGFTAATYMRGIDFIQIPTTLLSQVDSSIGGKTGVDFDQYKNMIGAFYQPKLVYMNLSVLNTLDERQFASGMAEILKHGLIKDADYYEWLIDHMDDILERNPDILEEMIEKSCYIKKNIVETDTKELGERALLNFGHTLGHAIEKEMGFQMLHGECVSLGIIAAAFISKERGLLSEEEFYEIRDMFVGFGLPITLNPSIETANFISAARSDKKMESGHIKFVLLSKIGNAFLDKSVTESEMTNSLLFMNYEIED